MKKKLISLALALVMVLSLFSVTAFASPLVVDEGYRGTYNGIVYAANHQNVCEGDIVTIVVEENTVTVTTKYMKGETEYVGVCYEDLPLSGFDVKQTDSSGDCCTISFNNDKGAFGNLTVYLEDEERSSAKITLGEDLFMSTLKIEETHKHAIDEAKHHGAVAPTCTVPGSVEYWECTEPGCNEHLDKDGKKIKAADFIIPALGHDFSGEAIEKGPAHCFKCVRSGCSATGLTDFAGRPVEGVVESHTNKDNDHKCDVCGCVMSECADDEGNDHLCDVCGKRLTECIDEEGDDGLCDICGEPMPTEPELPGFIGWIVNSMLRIVKLILARITLENLKPAIIGGTIVKIIEDAFAR